MALASCDERTAQPAIRLLSVSRRARGSVLACTEGRAVVVGSATQPRQGCFTARPHSTASRHRGLQQVQLGSTAPAHRSRPAGRSRRPGCSRHRSRRHSHRGRRGRHRARRRGRRRNHRRSLQVGVRRGGQRACSARTTDRLRCAGDQRAQRPSPGSTVRGQSALQALTVKLAAGRALHIGAVGARHVDGLQGRQCGTGRRQRPRSAGGAREPRGGAGAQSAAAAHGAEWSSAARRSTAQRGAPSGARRRRSR